MKMKNEDRKSDRKFPRNQMSGQRSYMEEKEIEEIEEKEEEKDSHCKKAVRLLNS